MAKARTRKAAPREPIAKQVLKRALEVANQSNNQYDRTEAKVDALAEYVLSLKG